MFRFEPFQLDVIKEVPARTVYLVKKQTVEPMTYEESQALDRLGDNNRAGHDLLELAKTEASQTEKPFAECLVAACENVRALPRNIDLLSAVRDGDLASLVESLVALADKWKSVTHVEGERVVLTAVRLNVAAKSA